MESTRKDENAAWVMEPELAGYDTREKWRVSFLEIALTGRHEIEIRFCTRVGKRGVLRIDNSGRSDFERVRRELMSRNARLPDDKKDAIAFVQELMRRVPSRPIVAVSSPMFCANGTGFVMPKYLYRAAVGRYTWDSENAPPHFGSVAGNFEAYSSGVLEPALESPYVTLSVLMALGSSLLGYVKSRGRPKFLTETAIFHFAGESSSGKTTLGLVANSVFGPPDIETDYEVTDRGIAEQAYQRNNLGVVIDDTENLGHDDREVWTKMQKFAHLVPSGRSKKISNRAAKAGLPAMRFGCFGISNGPKTFAEITQTLKFTRHGDRVRLLDIKIPDSEAGGIFGSAMTASGSGVENSAALVTMIERTIGDHHGVLFDRWIQHLLDNDLVDRIEKLVAHFVALNTHGEDGLEKRFAKKFAILYAAAVIGVEAGLLPWPKDWPMRAVRHCYVNSRKVRDPGAVYVKRALKRLADELDAGEKVPESKARRGQHPLWKEGQVGIRVRGEKGTKTWIAKGRLDQLCKSPDQSIDDQIFAKLVAIDCIIGKGSSQIRVQNEEGEDEKVRMWRLNASKLREYIETTRGEPLPSEK
jgi:hypothetical protein